MNGLGIHILKQLGMLYSSAGSAVRYKNRFFFHYQRSNRDIVYCYVNDDMIIIHRVDNIVLLSM